MDLILTNADAETFDRAGKRDGEEILGPFVQPDDVVLDLGCGIGRVVKYVAPQCREVWAVDASEKMLEMGRRRLSELGNVRFTLCTGTAFPDVPNAAIDFAYSLLTLQHVEREHAFMLLRELRRVVRPGGQAYLTFPNLLSDGYFRHFLQYVDTDETWNPARVRFYTPQEVERIVPETGFELVSVEAHGEIVVTCRSA
jgi:ubiquinone/menaquinone biosynthesis C-methylase UbiE